MTILGTIATAAVGILVPGAGIFGIVRRFGAKLVFGKVAGGLKSAGGFIATNWKPLAIIAVIAAAVIYVLILRGDLRHRDKIIAAQGVTLGAIKKEVDRGVGQPTQAVNAPAYIRNFVDNLATVTAALDRQTTALNAAKADANAHDDGAHQAAQPTPDERQRDKIRQQLKDPARVDGADTDWGRL